jgi:hypothetical protein
MKWNKGCQTSSKGFLVLRLSAVFTETRTPSTIRRKKLSLQSGENPTSYCSGAHATSTNPGKIFLLQSILLTATFEKRNNTCFVKASHAKNSLALLTPYTGTDARFLLFILHCSSQYEFSLVQDEE